MARRVTRRGSRDVDRCVTGRVVHGVLVAVVAFVAFVTLTATTVHAGEGDDFYPWHRPLDDSRAALNRRYNQVFTDALRDLNRGDRWRAMTCVDAAHEMTERLFWTEYRFLLRVQPHFGLHYAPRTNTEDIEQYRPRSLYHDVPFWWVPLTVAPLERELRVGDVTFSTDKIAHFFPTGWRYWRVYRERRAVGDDDDTALRAAIDQIGVATELGGWGLGIDGIFSFADLEANYQGLVFFQRLCDPQRPDLVKTATGWALRRPFDFGEWVNPCWDESYYGNTYVDVIWPAIAHAMAEKCSLLARPHVAAQRARYRALGCTSPSVRILEEYVAAGHVPDPRPFDIETVCNNKGAAHGQPAHPVSR